MSPVDMPTLSFAYNIFFKLLKFRYRDASVLIYISYAYILYVCSYQKLYTYADVLKPNSVMVYYVHIIDS